MKNKITKTIIILFLSFILLISYLPIFVMFFVSFSKDRTGSYFGGFTFKWYMSLKDLQEPILFTLFVSVISTLFSCILGTISAIGIHSLNKKARNRLLFLNNIPIINADIITGIFMLIFFQLISILVGKNILGYTTTILSHILFSTPYIILSVLPKLNELNPNLLDASMDLGCSKTRSLFKVILPSIKSSILAGSILAFTMSIDDFIITYFVSGKHSNFSTWLVSNLKTLKTGAWNKACAYNTLLIIISFISIIIYQLSSIKKTRKKKFLSNDLYIKKLEKKYKENYFKKIFFPLSIVAFFILFIFLCIFSKKNKLYILTPGDYIGSSVIRNFEKKYNCTVCMANADSNERIMNNILLSKAPYDICILSDYMIEKMSIDKNLLEIDMSYSKNYSNNMFLDPVNDIINDLYYKKYFIPYFWGSLGIMYNKKGIVEDIIKKNGYKIFFEDFKGLDKSKIGMYDSSRDSFCICQIYKNYDINSNNLKELEDCYKLLKSRNYNVWGTDDLKVKIAKGELDACLCYTGDYFDMYYTDLESSVNRKNNYSIFIPRDYNNVFIDGICMPKTCENKDLAMKFIDYLLDIDISINNRDEIGYCPVIKKVYDQMIQNEDKYSHILSIDGFNPGIIKKGLIYKNLNKETYNKLESLFNDLRINN